MVRKTKVSRRRAGGKPIAWEDPEVMWFAGDEELPVGAIRQHGLSDLAGSIFGKKKEDVEAEWKKVVSQISSLISIEVPLVKNFDLEEITFELGFSAEGHIVFVAKAGIKTTISAKFKRRL